MERPVPRLINFCRMILGSTGLVLAFTTLVGCGGKEASTNKPTAKGRILTEAEKEYLATTTIYYIANFEKEDNESCADGDKINLLRKDGTLITKSCKRVYNSCNMQGTCQIEVQGKKEILNVDTVIGGFRRFKVITNSVCKYGNGARRDYTKRKFTQMCLDPFYSVAADLSLYKLGDVIFLPDVKGLQLPDGTIHNGFFIVRDAGGNIKGKGRFDFFTGFYGPFSSTNPFAKIKLNGKQTFPRYEHIPASEVSNIITERNFPALRAE